ncbi:hypothetical protein KAW43_01565 [Candidatus Parcubacteria bacterium]|nr:hypothetical protein [Candidatus Parcubacteria bacterium]
MIKTKKIFKKKGIEVRVARGSIHTLETIKAGTEGIGVGEKVISLNWGKNSHERQGRTIVCEKPSLSIERKDILSPGNTFEIASDDIIYYLVRHLSVLIDCCKEKNFSFIDSTFGRMEEILEETRFIVAIKDADTRNIISFLWGTSG